MFQLLQQAKREDVAQIHFRSGIRGLIGKRRGWSWHPRRDPYVHLPAWARRVSGSSCRGWWYQRQPGTRKPPVPAAGHITLSPLSKRSSLGKSRCSCKRAGSDFCGSDGHPPSRGLYPCQVRVRAHRRPPPCRPRRAAQHGGDARPAQPGPARPAALPRPPAPPAVELPQPMGAALAGAAPAGAVWSRETAGGGRSRVGDKAGGTPPPLLPPPPLPTHRPGNRRPRAPPPGPGPGPLPHPLFVPKESHTPPPGLSRRPDGLELLSRRYGSAQAQACRFRTTPIRRQQAQSVPAQWRCSLAHAFHRGLGTPLIRQREHRCNHRTGLQILHLLSITPCSLF